LNYFDQIEDLVKANGWEKVLIVERVSAAGQSPIMVQIRLQSNHLTAPNAIVNVYVENVHPLEQVQQECLRALRTGRPGI
jgi:hypothetical protein